MTHYLVKFDAVPVRPGISEGPEALMRQRRFVTQESVITSLEDAISGGLGKMHATTTLDFQVLNKQYRKDPLANYEYGTAGFRMDAKLMPPVAFRVGLFMASLHGTEAIGVMLTASHNPVGDNGIKLASPTGEMMEGIEEDVTRVCNMNDRELEEWMCTFSSSPRRPVLIGRDTRPSGPELFDALSAGLLDKADIFDCGLVTTPQLHHYVRSFNTFPGCSILKAESMYLSMLTSGFRAFANEEQPVDIVIDCANGVGACTMRKLPKLPGLNIRLVNTGEGELNKECGADFVKLYQKAPSRVEPSSEKHFASFDGDADRVVFFRFDDEGRFHLLDGDRIAVLIAETFMKLLSDSGIEASVGVVQTAYANGASTKHLKSMGVKAMMTYTGVKNLHHEAKHFDIGIYFEANGHGTVLFSSRFKEALEQAGERASIISSLAAIVNECVGDAISDLLLVEAILSLRHLTLAQWESAYTELPSVQLKIKVANRADITTTNADQTVVKPAGLQAEIDSLVSSVPQGRAFVRPSGTEDVVRVYTEAGSKAEAEALGEQVSCLVKKFLLS